MLRVWTRAPASALQSSSSSSSSSSSNSSPATRNQKAKKTYPPTRQVEQHIVQLGRQGRFQEAITVYQAIDPTPTIRIWNAVLDACSRSAQLEGAMQLWQEGMDSHKLRPNVFTFGALMNACNRDRNPAMAMQILKRMKNEFHVKPNAVVYASAISACARAQPDPWKEAALTLLQQAVEEDHVEMTVVAFNAAISACAQEGDWHKATQLVTRMEQACSSKDNSNFRIPAPDVVTYGTVLAACEKGEQWESLLQYAKFATRELGIVLDGIALTSCLHACQQLGYADQAMLFLDQMKQQQQKRNQRKQQQQTNQQRYAGAKQPLVGPDAVAYQLAISACARGGAWQQGIRLLEEYIATSKTTENSNDDNQHPPQSQHPSSSAPAIVMAYTAAITGCEYAGKWKEAMSLMDKMRRDDIQPNEVTMAAVIGACATAIAKTSNATAFSMPDSSDEKTDKYPPLPQQKALQLLDILKQHPTLPKPNIQVYNAAIRVCAEAGDVAGAFELLEEVEGLGLARTEVTYGSLMTACERVGDAKLLSKAFNKLKAEPDITPNEIMFGAAISCCRKARQSEWAYLILKKMIEDGLSPNLATLNTVLMAQTDDSNSTSDQQKEGTTDKQGGEEKTSPALTVNAERAMKIYRWMRNAPSSSSFRRPNLLTYNILIPYFAKTLINPEWADALLQDMRSTEGLRPDVKLFTTTIASFEKAGKPFQALRLMELMEKDGYDFYSVKVLNAAFSKAVKVANQMGRTMSSPSSKTVAATELASLEDDDEASANSTDQIDGQI